MIAAALTVILAQTCAAMLPKPNLEVEWLRNGKAWARDVPIEATALTRTYRRTMTGGARSVRTLSCTNGTGGVVITESINSERQVRLPLALKTGQSRRIDGALIRRVKPPSNAATNAFWFVVAADAARIYGVREGIGIVEMRVQSLTGSVDVFRAFARTPAPAPVTIAASPPELESELARLQAENRALQDSVAELRDELMRIRGEKLEPDHDSDDSVPPAVSPVDDRLLTFTGADAYVEQGNYPAAIALLVRARGQLTEYKRLTNAEHPATPRVVARMNEVIRACQRANPRQLSICAVR